jgi:hypothetical protein
MDSTQILLLALTCLGFLDLCGSMLDLGLHREQVLETMLLQCAFQKGLPLSLTDRMAPWLTPAPCPILVCALQKQGVINSIVNMLAASDESHHHHPARI